MLGTVAFDRFPDPRGKKNQGRHALWKLTQLWKSTKVAFGDFFLMISTSCLEKPPPKNAAAFPQFPQRRRRLITTLKNPGKQTQHFFYSRGCSN
jgi:hypothetical protein